MRDGEVLQIAEVGRGHDRGATSGELIDDRRSQRGPLGRVGAGANFVGQDQRLRPGRAQRRGQVLHV